MTRVYSAKRLLCLLAFLDILDENHEPSHRAIRCNVRHIRTADMPHIRPFIDQGALEANDFSAKRAVHLRTDVFGHGLTQNFGHALVSEGRCGPAEPLRIPAIHESVTKLAINVGHESGHAIDDELKLNLSTAESIFGALSFGDIQKGYD